jgi:uncharacterized protein (TIGR02145 family)
MCVAHAQRLEDIGIGEFTGRLPAHALQNRAEEVAALSISSSYGLHATIIHNMASLPRISAVAIALPIALAAPLSKRMADGKLWSVRNLDVPADPSYCYDNAEANCRQYGRLYTWESAQRACQSLGEGWRLPTNDEWRQLAKSYGGLLEESEEAGKSAYQALRTGGNSGFDVVLGGGRNVDGQYARLGAHGFYWTASQSDATHAWLYNFGKGMLALNAAVARRTVRKEWRTQDAQRGYAFLLTPQEGGSGESIGLSRRGGGAGNITKTVDTNAKAIPAPKVPRSMTV